MVMFRELTLNKVRHCRSTPYELAFMSIIVWKEMYSTYRWQTANYLKPSLTWNRAETGSNTRQPRSQGRLVFHRHLGKREDPGDEVDSNPGGQPGGLTGDTLRLFVGSSGFPCCRCRGSGGVGWRFHNTFTSRSWCMAKSGTAEGEGLLLLLLGFYFLGRAYNYGLLFCSTPADMIKIFLELLSGMFA